MAQQLLLFKLFIKIYLLSQFSTAEPTNGVTLEDLKALMESSMSTFKQNIDMLTSNLKLLDERVDTLANPDISDDKWRSVKAACIRGNNYKHLTEVSTIIACKKICVKELGSSCGSIDYRPKSKECNIATLRSDSSDYTEPCYERSADWFYSETEAQIDISDYKWRSVKAACIRGNNYKHLTEVSTIIACKEICVKELGSSCGSIDYRPKSKECNIATLRSDSSDYTEPCYEGSADWFYSETEAQIDDKLSSIKDVCIRADIVLGCPKGYFKPQGSNQCYFGCPEGFFMLPAPSFQCLKFFNGSTLSWEDANTKCLEEGLVMARPDDGLAVRQYITEKYGAQGVISRAWLGARGHGSYVAWQRGGDKISPDNPLWWPGHPGTTSITGCMQLLSDDHHRKKNPGKPYAIHVPCTESGHHNALCELVRD